MLGEGSSSTHPPASRTPRPSSVSSSSRLQVDNVEEATVTQEKVPQTQNASAATQTLSTAPVFINYEFTPSPKIERLSYSVGIQTTEPRSPPRRNKSTDGLSDSDGDQSPSIMRSPRNSKRLSRREREREDELRQNLRREIEAELKAVKDPTSKNSLGEGEQKYPARTLSGEEMNAVTSSEDFLDFVERSSKVIEKALDQEYDILADYAVGSFNGIDEDEDEGYASSRGKKSRRIKEIAQFYDERWSKKRMISDICFSPKVCLLPGRAPIHTADCFTFSFPNSS